MSAQWTKTSLTQFSGWLNRVGVAFNTRNKPVSSACGPKASDFKAIEKVGRFVLN